MEDFTLDLEVDEEHLAQTAVQWMAVGKIITERSLDDPGAINALRAIWPDNIASDICNLGNNTFSICFSDEKHMDDALDSRPWTVMESCFSLQRWLPDQALSEINFWYVPYWLQIHDLPLELMSKKNAEIIGSKIGSVVEIEEPFCGNGGGLRRSFLRIRVMVNVQSPLFPGFWFPRKEGTKTWAIIKYEKLSDFCYRCGRIDHGEDSCQEVVKKDEAAQRSIKFGPQMRALPSAKISHNGELEIPVPSEHAQSNKGMELKGSKDEMLVRHSDLEEDKHQTVAGVVGQPESGNTADGQSVEDPPSSKFIWRIENYSRLNKKNHYSDIFLVGGYKWRVLVFPRGNNVDHLSIYLDVADSASLPHGWSRCAQYSLKVISLIDNNYSVKKDTQHQFKASENDWGFTSFMPLSELDNPSRGYLVNDTLIVEAEVSCS